MKKVFSLVLALLLTGSSVVARATEDADPIRIGVFEPLTGSKREGGMMELEGIRLAHAMVPEVLGRPVELVIVDNESMESTAVTAAQSLVYQGVDIVVGSWGSSLAIAGAPVFDAARIPAIGTSCTNPEVTRNHPYYFRVCYVDDFQGTLLADYARDTLGAQTAAIICDISNVYAIGLRNFFRDAFGPENILIESYFSTGEDNFTQQLEDIRTMNPDVIFMPSDYTEPALLMRQAYDMEYSDVVFLGADTWETDALITLGGKGVEGCRFTTFYDVHAEPTEASETFLAAYAEMYGGEPKGAVTALAYDAYMAAVKAIEAAGSTKGKSIQLALLSLSFEGVTGPISFAQTRDANVTQAVIKTVENGKFVYLDTIHVGEQEEDVQ